MNVLHLNASDIKGGAAKAAYRLHQGLQQQGVRSEMLVQWKHGDSPDVIGPGSKLRTAIHQARPNLVAPLIRRGQRSDTHHRSINLLPSGLPRRINAMDVDIVNLHWINGEMMSIADIAHLKKPLVWTLHDMWPFCGAEHYTQDVPPRYREGYTNRNRGAHEKGWDLDRWVWQRKQKHWRALPLHIVTPSRWLAECARTSALFARHRIDVIPYGIDVNRYKPVPAATARDILNLPQDKTLILFGAMHATSDRRKGFHLLNEALHRLPAQQQEKTELVVFGASRPHEPSPFNIQTHYMGQLHDDVSLVLLYAAADVFVAPSLQDNLPNTVLEAMACGTPCAAFKAGGLPDLIDHQQTGYLAAPFEPADLAGGIHWIVADQERHNALSQRSRTRVETHFSLEKQAAAYLTLYQNILSPAAK